MCGKGNLKKKGAGGSAGRRLGSHHTGPGFKSDLWPLIPLSKLSCVIKPKKKIYSTEKIIFWVKIPVLYLPQTQLDVSSEISSCFMLTNVKTLSSTVVSSMPAMLPVTPPYPHPPDMKHVCRWSEWDTTAIEEIM